MKSSIWITFEEKNELQKDKCYAPAKWMWRDKNHVGSGLAKKLSEPSRNFSLTRDSFLKGCINSVYYQHSAGQDYVDIALENERKASEEKICSKCGCETDVSFRICRNCKGKGGEAGDYANYHAEVSC